MARVPRSVTQVGRKQARSQFPAQKIAGQLEGLNQGTGRALQQAGGQIAEVAFDFRDRQFDREKGAALSDLVTTLPLSQQAVVDAAKKEAPPGAKGFADDVTKRLDDNRKVELGRIAEQYDLRESDLEDLTQRAARLDTPNVSNAFAFEQGERVRFFGQKLQTQAEGLTASIRRDPTSTSLDMRLTEFEAALKGVEGNFDARQVAEFRELATAKFHAALIEGAIDQDPGGALERLRAGEFDKFTEKGLTSDELARFTKRADVEHRQLVAEQERRQKEQRAIVRGRVNAGLKDEVASIRRTGKSAGVIAEADIRSAYGDEPDKAQAIIDELGQEQEFYTTRQQVALTPLSEDLALLEENAPEGEGFAVEAARQDLLIKAVQDKRKALAEDPTGYLLQVSPGLAEAFQEAEEPTDVQAAIDAVMNEQERMGVPQPGRQPLSAAQAVQLVGTYAEQQDAQARADWMRAQADIYGEHWPKVSGQMIEAGLPGGAIVLTSMTRPEQNRAAVAMAEAQEIGTKGLKDALGSEVSGDVADAVRAAMTEFDLSMANVPGGATTANTYRDEVFKLAMLYTQQGSTAGDAAIRAAGDVVNDYYSFFGTYRVPSEFQGGLIAQRAHEFKRSNLTDLDLALPFDPQLEQAEIKKQYLAAIRDKGFWLTNADETGLVLMHEQGGTVTTMDGEPVEVLFEDLAKMRRAPPKGAILPTEQLPGMRR